MSNRGYSPEALERRKKQARESFRRKYHSDPEFRAKQHGRHKKRYHENKESEKVRSKEYYERNKLHQRFLGRTQFPESSDIHKAINAFKFGEITFDEFNRRFSDALTRLDERVARKRSAR